MPPCLHKVLHDAGLSIEFSAGSGSWRGKPDPLPPPEEQIPATDVELIETAVGLRPKLLIRALELHDGRRADAEDAVADAYLAFCRKPPSPKSAAQLHHWLRTVLVNQRNSQLRKLYRDDTVVVSLDVLHGWTG